MNTSKPGVLGQVLSYAENRKKLTLISLVLSVLTAVASLMPFVYLWRIIQEVIEIGPNFSQSTNIIHNG